MKKQSEQDHTLTNDATTQAWSVTYRQFDAVQLSVVTSYPTFDIFRCFRKQCTWRIDSLSLISSRFTKLETPKSSNEMMRVCTVHSTLRPAEGSGSKSICQHLARWQYQTSKSLLQNCKQCGSHLWFCLKIKQSHEILFPFPLVRMPPRILLRNLSSGERTQKISGFDNYLSTHVKVTFWLASCIILAGFFQVWGSSCAAIFAKLEDTLYMSSLSFGRGEKGLAMTNKTEHEEDKHWHMLLIRDRTRKKKTRVSPWNTIFYQFLPVVLGIFRTVVPA